jgi:hypothetical protein
MTASKNSKLEVTMNAEDRYPHFDFNFKLIRQYWTTELGNYMDAKRYLRIVGKRLGYWLQNLGSWIDFSFAIEHAREDLHLSDVESNLTWLALRRRVKWGNQQKSMLPLRERERETCGVGVKVQISEDGIHDAVWHDDFRRLYFTRLAKERKLLKRLYETGSIPKARIVNEKATGMSKDCSNPERPHIQWLWSSRLLAYLFESLRENEAVEDEGAMWAAIDGVFTDRSGKTITRKDLALWAYQYHNNKVALDEQGKPKKHERIDSVIEQIHGI